MSSCVSTTVRFYGKEDVLDRLENLIKEWRSKKYCDNGWDRDSESYLIWLGNIVGNSGIDDRSKGDFKIYCRGYICDVDRSEGYLTIMQETKNQIAVEMWRRIVEKYDLDLKVLYWSECDCCDFITNDPHYENRYVIDCINNELYDKDFPDFDDEVSKETLIEMLQKLLSTKINDIEELIEKVEEEYDDIWFHQWDVVPLSECP